MAMQNNMEVDDTPTHNASWADQMEEVSHNAPGDIEEVSLPSFHFSAQPGPPHVEPSCPPGPLGHTTHEAPDTSVPSVIPYDENLPADPTLWDGSLAAISLFGTKELFDQNAANLIESLQRAATFIRQRSLSGGNPNTITQLTPFGGAAWNLISAIYEAQWDKLFTYDNISFRERVASQFNRPTKLTRTVTPNAPKSTGAKISRIPPPIPPRLSPKALKKAKDKHRAKKLSGQPVKKSFAQVTKGNENNLLKLREAFPALPARKIIKMNNISAGKSNPKPKIQSTTKGLSRKNILVPLTATDTLNVINKANAHVGQLNTLFKACKSKINADCICETGNSITITTSSVAAPSDLMIIEQYFKGLDDVESNNISPRLPQSKSFLKILGIPYTDLSSASPINSMQIESVLTKLSMLKDITLASPPCVIHTSKNSDMAVI